MRTVGFETAESIRGDAENKIDNAHARATTDGAGFKVLPGCKITWKILFAYWSVLVAMGPEDPNLWSLRILHSRRMFAIQRCSSKQGRIQHSHW